MIKISHRGNLYAGNIGESILKNMLRKSPKKLIGIHIFNEDQEDSEIYI